MPCKWTVIALFLGWRGGEKTFPPLLFPQISSLPPSFLRPPKRCLFRRPFFPFPGFLSRFKLAWKKKKRKLLHRLFSPAFLWGIYLGEWEEFEAKKNKWEKGGGRRKKQQYPLFDPFCAREFLPRKFREKLYFPAFLNIAHILLAFFFGTPPTPKWLQDVAEGFSVVVCWSILCPNFASKISFYGEARRRALLCALIALWASALEVIIMMITCRRRGEEEAKERVRSLAITRCKSGKMDVWNCFMLLMKFVYNPYERIVFIMQAKFTLFPEFLKDILASFFERSKSKKINTYKMDCWKVFSISLFLRQ